MSKKINSNELIGQLQAEVKELISICEGFKKEPEEVLRKSPAEDKWNSMECLRHLNLTAELYLPRIEKKINFALGEQQTPALEFKSNVLGELSINSMKPNKKGLVNRKMKTADIIDPRKVVRGNKEIATFLLYQKRFLDLLESAREVDLNKVRIKSPIVKLVNFKLGNAFRFVIAHEQRHIQQAVQSINTVKNL